MYDPAQPNHYRDVVFTAYVRRRQREEAAELERQRRPNALADALFAVDATRADVAPSAAAPTRLTLGLSAEELHQQRVQESAALGVQRAVAMEKDALEVAHQQRRLEGSDARSRISSKLDKLKALAAKSRAVTGASAPGGVAAPASGGDVASLPTDPSAAGPSPACPASSAPSAPLVFQRSGLAAGGYVMTAAAPPPPGGGSGLTAARAAVQGKPSSTLLLRFLHGSPLRSWSPEAIAQAAAATADARSASSADTPPWAASVLAPVQQRCRRFGFVRHMAARVYTAGAVRAALARRRLDPQKETSTDTTPGDASAAEVLREQLRMWVRFDSVTEAFKAAEKLAQELASVSSASSSPTPDSTSGGDPLFAVCFYPTSLFDADALELREEDLLLPSPRAA